MTSAMPPSWAETLLRLVLDSRDRATVSGDLLEEFRESIRPTRGPSAADSWYIRQVMGFVGRSNVVPAFLFGGAFVVRTALDWLPPRRLHPALVDFNPNCDLDIAGVRILCVLEERYDPGWRPVRHSDNCISRTPEHRQRIGSSCNLA